MVVKNDEQYNTLLTYYRNKIEEFDKERQEWLTKIEEIRISYEDKHSLEWELIKRKEEISELQRTLTEAKLMLFEERHATLRLQRENDMLKVKEMEDRKKIQELMALGGSQEEQIILQRDIRPETTNKYKTNELYLNTVSAKETNKRQTNSSQSKQTSIGRSVIKTIYLPNEQLNEVALENESLKRLLDESQQLLAQQHAALQEEVRNIEEDSRARRFTDLNLNKTLQERLQKLEKHNIDMNKEFYLARQSYGVKERQLNEESDNIRQKNHHLNNLIQENERKNNSENKAAINLLEKKTDDDSKKYKNKARQKEENLQILKEQYAQIQQIYIQKIRQLEENLSKLIEKYQTLEKRRVLEIEGFKTDIRRLNQRLKDYDQKVSGNKFQTMKLDEMKQYKVEAQELREQAFKQTQQVYSDPNQTKKMPKNKNKSLGKTQKRPQRQINQSGDFKQQNQNDDSLNNIEEEDNDYQSSLPLHELEEIQQQLEELEHKMDAAKR